MLERNVLKNVTVLFHSICYIAMIKIAVIFSFECEDSITILVNSPKIFTMKAKYLFIAVLLLTGLEFGACKKSSDNNTPANITFLATLDGASETPPTGSAATGSATFTFNPTTYELSGTVTFTGMVATASHIHTGAVGVAGPVTIPLDGANPTSPISLPATVLTSQEQNDLLSGLFYVNVHSVAFPAGEIRGQLVKQ